MLGPLSVAWDLRLNFVLKLERSVTSFPSQPIAVIGSASAVDYAASLCVLASFFMGSSFRIERKPEVDLRVYTKAGDVACGSWSFCVDCADPVSGSSRGCLFAVVSVRTAS